VSVKTPVAALPMGPALDFLARLWRLEHAREQLSGRMERRWGVTAQQRMVIRCIGTYPGITAGQLAATLHVDAGTVSATLRRLEERQLVQRRRDPNDSRRVTLGLTPAGRRLDAPAEGTVEAAVTELLRDVDPAQLAATVAVLERLRSLLDATLGE